MKRLIIIAFFIFISSIIYGQNKLKKLDVKEVGFDITMNFQPIIDNITYKGLSINIIPVSADELNSEFLEESFFNGKFKYSHFRKSRESYFLKKKRGKRMKSDLEFFLEGISWLYDNDKINENEFNNLERQILYYFDEEYAEQYYKGDEITISNPYYLENKYLNVFKINISNPTNSHIVLDKNLIIENGNILLDPLSTDLLSKEIDTGILSLKKMMTLERHNLKNNIIIPPKSQVEKYFAILPIDFNSPILSISLDGMEKKLSWKIIKDENTINELYSFYELVLKWKSYYNIKFSLLGGDSNSIFIDENKLFIEDESLNDVFEIFTISLNRNTLSYGRNIDLIGKEFVDIDRYRRKTIRLDLQKIDELKKKVKE